MIQIFIVALSLSGFLPLTTPHVFSESTLDMLTQCNRYQTEMFADNRTTHSCETENYSESFSYVIEKLQTRYSKQHFWCFLFLKDEYFKLKFKLWFSHKDFIVDAVSHRVDDRSLSEILDFRMESNSTNPRATNGSQGLCLSYRSQSLCQKRIHRFPKYLDWKSMEWTNARCAVES